MEMTTTKGSVNTSETSSTIVHSVFTILKLTFIIVPVVAGLDKFTNLLTNWELYLNPGISALLPFGNHVFMMIIGLIEISAGILVFVRPAIGGLVVMAWLSLIAITLLISGHYFDVAVRDFVMAIGAFSMARLAKVIDQK